MAPEAALSAECVAGFTGTREGMTVDQAVTVEGLLSDWNVVEVHHGDCVGADADFDRIARQKGAVVIVHPPEDPKLRAYCTTAVEYPERPYLARNRDIVDCSELLIATPKETTGATKGGTWYTVKYARKQGRGVVIVWPDGSTLIDGEVPGS
jgi:hypothetical protein